MACLRSFPMNDLVIHLHDRDRAIKSDREDNRRGDLNMENRQKGRRRRRWGGRLFTLGGFLLLAGGVSLGAWANYSQRQEVMTTAQHERDFVPSVRVATVEASPGTIPVGLPGTTAAFAAANIYARAT